MTAAELLQQFEAQTHTQRVAAMLALGRQNDGESHAIITQLEQGNMYERMLALYSCFGSRESAHALRALADPSRLIRGLAIRLAALLANEAELLHALQEVASVTRPGLLAQLYRQRRHSIIDHYLALPATQEDTQFCAVASFGSHEAAARIMPQFVTQATPSDWRHLARRHPTLVLDHLLEQARAASAWDGPLLSQVNDLLPLLVRAHAPQALELVRELARTVELASIRYAPLAQRMPSAVADLLLAADPADIWRMRWLRNSANKLTTEQIIAFYQHTHNIFGWDFAWFGKLAPDQRTTIYARCAVAFLGDNESLPEGILAGLAEDVRIREARQIVSSTKISLDARIYYAKYLPWDEMKQILDAPLHSSEVATRQSALASLIQSILFHRTRLMDVLLELRERRTEQDGTRQVMLSKLHALPQSLWRDEHLPILAEIIRHGLDDVGLSAGTQRHIIHLLLKLMPAHQEWAAAQFLTVLGERGWTQPSHTIALLPPAPELSLAQALMPQLERWTASDDDGAALATVKSLFVRPAAFAMARPTLDQILQGTRDRSHASDALALIAERAPGELANLAPRLLVDDASWITFLTISSWLLRHRQDLLTSYLDLKPIAGRWETRRKLFLLPLFSPFGGGTAIQQQRLGEAALARIADTTQKTNTITEAIKILPMLPALAPDRITPLADDPRSTVRTTALFALAHLDTAAGVPTLIAALQDARARIAIHAVRSSVRQMPITEALTLLRGVPFGRVTVAKEVVRLVSELDAPEAWEQLVAYSQQDLHRDVRVALIQSLDRHLHRAQAWEMLEDATRNPDPVIAQASLALPTFAASSFADQSSSDMQIHVLRLIANLLEHPAREARDACRSYCAQLGIADDAHMLTPQLVSGILAGAHTDATTEQQEEAINTIGAFFGVCSASDTETTADLIRALTPHRVALTAAVDELDGAPRFEQRRLMPVLRAAVSALADDPLTIIKRMQLALEHLPQAELVQFLLGLSGQPALHANTLYYAAEKLQTQVNRFSADELEALEMSLASSNDAAMRWLAYNALLMREKKEGGWTDALLARLITYRNDSAPLVASDAQFNLSDSQDF